MKLRLIQRTGKKDLWQVDVGVVNGRRVQKSFVSRERAEEFLETIRKEGQAAIAMSGEDRTDFYRNRARVEAVGATLTEAVDFFLTHKASTKKAPPIPELLQAFNLHLYSVASQKYADQTTRTVARPLGGIESVFQITRDFIIQEVKRGVSASTKQSIRAAFSTFCSWLLAQHYISTHPLEGRANRITIRKPPSDGPTAFGVR
ncbi:MAG: hypothetical protein RLZZ142_1135 [Verrucomicrobiota bacterium]